MDGRRVVLVNDRGYTIGQDHCRAKLTNHEVDLIHELRDAGLTYLAIAEKFEVAKSTIAGIVNGTRRGYTAVGQRTLPALPRSKGARETMTPPKPPRDALDDLQQALSYRKPRPTLASAQTFTEQLQQFIQITDQAEADLGPGGAQAAAVIYTAKNHPT